METITNKTPVVLLTGFVGRERAAELARPGTVVVAHDLSGLESGLVTRAELTAVRERTTLIELAHGCVSCTVREDLLPLLRHLHRRSGVDRIVVALDPRMEAAPVREAIETVPVRMVGAVTAPAGRDVEVVAVIGVLDGGRWLADALGDQEVGERMPVTGDDVRTVAQLALAQVDAATVIVVDGDAPDPARLRAVLRRVAPGVPIVREDVPLESALARRAADRREPGVFGPLLRGAPPLESDGDVRLSVFSALRPMHPGRLHEAIDALLDGVVTARGRLWLATRQDHALWLESAGAGLRVERGGRWLAAGGDGPPERWAMAALTWDEEYGDRHSALTVLTAGAEPDRVLGALRWAELTDDEYAAGPQTWAAWPDPFGELHADPCADSPVGRETDSVEGTVE